MKIIKLRDGTDGQVVALVFGLFLALLVQGWAAEGEDHLLLLRNGDRVCGVAPQIGGKVLVFRMKSGENVLDGRPESWSDKPSSDVKDLNWKQYFGESVWSGPQADWWTAKEPYPIERIGTWPPDPAWEMAPFAVIEKTPTRVVMRSSTSALTGLELTKTVELLADGSLRFQVRAVNRGAKAVTRDLWLIHRVPLAARCFAPLESEIIGPGVTDAARVQRIAGLTVIEPKPEPSLKKDIGGKIMGTMKEGWMATILSGTILTVRFQPTDPAKVAPGHAAAEIFVSSALRPLFELEHHGELKTLRPGEEMESKEMWELKTYTGQDTAEAQARFLQRK